MNAIAIRRQTILADSHARGGARRRASLTLVQTGRADRVDRAIVRVGADLTTLDTASPTPPIWWPTTLAWPPNAASPPIGWPTTTPWPPANAIDAAGGASALAAKNLGSGAGGGAGGGAGSGTGGGTGSGIDDGHSMIGIDDGHSMMPGVPDLTGLLTKPLPPAQVNASIVMSPGQKDAISAGAGAIFGGIVGKLALASTTIPVVAGVVGGVILGGLIGHAIYALATGNPVTSVATKGCDTHAIIASSAKR